MAEFSINNPNGYLAGPLGSFRVYGADGRLKAIGAGGGGGATWGTITGNILNQTDLINYINSQVGSGFVPETRTLTINGVTYDLTADRTWSIPAGGTVTDVTGTGTVSGLTLTGSGTTSVTLTLGGSLVLVASDITTALGYTPLSQATADTLYYPLTANPSNYVTSSGLTTILSNYLTTAAAASTYLTIVNAAATYQPIFTTQNGLTYGGGLLQLGGTLTQSTVITGDNYRYSLLDLDYYQSQSNSYTHLESGKCVSPVFQTNSYSIDGGVINGQTVFNLGNVTSGVWTCGDPLLTPEIGGTFFVSQADGNNTATILAYDINTCEITLDVPITWVGIINNPVADIDVVVGTVDNAYLLLDRNGDHPEANGLPTASVILQDCATAQEVGVKAVNDGGTKKLRLLTNDYTNKTAGDVVTLVDPATGEVEFQTPTGGGGGLEYGIAAGTNTYTVTIAGVTGYVDGDTYAIKFTNGNDDDSTININGLGVKTLVKQADIQVTGGDIVSGQELIIIYDGTNFQCIGVAPNQLFAYVTNDDSVTITKGQPVYAFGSAGNRMSVKLAYNTSDATSAQTIGLVFSASIAAGQKGFIITQGVISGLNTAAYSAGAQLYLGATAGSLTSTKPSAPNHLVYVGIVERSNAGNGQIYVKPQNGYELDELHDVVATSPANNDYMYYDSSTSLYRLRQFTAAQITDSTTVGQNIVKLPDPSAVSYLRINADNTVTALTLAQLKSDLGLNRTVLASDVSTTAVSTALVDVTGLTFPIVAGNTYKFTAYLVHTTSVANTGLKWAVNADVAVSNITYRTLQNGGVVSAFYIHHANALNSASTNSGATQSNHINSIEGILVANNTGTAIIRFGKSQANAGTLTVKAGSFVEYEII